MIEVLTGIAVLSGVSAGLTVLLLIAEAWFADYGECVIDVNAGERQYKVKGGSSLLRTLSEQKLFLPSGCGGRGSCGTCKCRVLEGGGPILPTETPYLNETERRSQVRLSCQVKVKENIRIEVPAELLNVREFVATTVRITQLTHDIRGLRFELPPGETIKFKAGQFVNLVSQPYGDVTESTSRAYSISSPPSDNRALELVIRLVPNGMVTTWVFQHLKEGQPVTLIGPYGEFFLRESSREIIFIAGGSGLAPIRSIILDMIDRGITHRPATFFFGAVKRRDLYYVEEFERIAAQHPWFRYKPALSGDETDHPYERGLITDVVARHYGTLDHHEAYLCGSPGMINACVKVLTQKGLPEHLIFYDKFS
ncbi:MAG: Na(+)-translocating NADH-quinone reductase subunit F [Candidatus Ozemobacter sibiricus]|jgi:Na+-transporting NADH:ubiquinone oxidoreductase subunit F|uniref:Na(+)-translocating NADH-quinone reductase subunit F n=1 Tax=Candidatus Ozemobacter sibiricus TaxID=2268124 RepID=A0A367ZNV5_9BACT|nr:MAG: Na(+)-translocating NADH-quinone reductase subunit F [Candidatus Ozemobacter sibiricus]